jgi:hypothetical protein
MGSSHRLKRNIPTCRQSPGASDAARARKAAIVSVPAAGARTPVLESTSAYPRMKAMVARADMAAIWAFPSRKMICPRQHIRHCYRQLSSQPRHRLFSWRLTRIRSESGSGRALTIQNSTLTTLQCAIYQSRCLFGTMLLVFLFPSSGSNGLDCFNLFLPWG